MRIMLAKRVQYGNGQYVTREQIEQRRALSVSELLKGMRGVQLRSAGMSTVVVMSRSAGPSARGFGGFCVPTFMVDGSIVGSESRVGTVDAALNGTGAEGGGRFDGLTSELKSNENVVMARDVGPDQFVNVNEIEVVEVYESINNVPPEFQMFANTCGLVAIWTRRGGLVRVKEEGEGL